MYINGCHYFVKFDGEWTIGRFDANGDGSIGLEWSIVASDEPFNESDFDEIGDLIELPTS